MQVTRRLGSHLFQWILRLALLSLVDGQCNTCSVATNVACVSQTEYQFCVDGSPNSTVSSCPIGYVCTTTGSIICQPNQNGIVAACGVCNVCDSTGTFACTDNQTFALCLNGMTPSNSTGSCAANYVCNIELTQICGDVSLGVVPSCRTTTSTTTTTTSVPITTRSTVSPISFPQRYCRQLQQSGRFPVGNGGNNTCKQYVYCAANNGVWSGQILTCPGQTYFNSSSGLCGNGIPVNCTSL